MHASLWSRYCDAHRIAATSVPLFDADAAGVVRQRVTPSGRGFLVRSPAMEARVEAATREVFASPAADGLLYLMHTLDASGGGVPLYAGKAERIGRSGRPSVNLTDVGLAGRHKFARWGDGYAYHVGDLSACACEGHGPERTSTKYRHWAEALFAETGARVRLRRDVRFWVTPRDRRAHASGLQGPHASSFVLV